MAFLAFTHPRTVSKSQPWKNETAKFFRLKGARWGERPREPGYPRPRPQRLARTLAPPCAGFSRESQPSTPDFVSCACFATA